MAELPKVSFTKFSEPRSFNYPIAKTP